VAVAGVHRGEADYLSDGTTRLEIAGGHALMARVEGIGAGLAALAAACLTVEPDPLAGTAAALAFHAAAGRAAADSAQGPGSFQAAYLDALSLIGAEAVEREARVTVL
ncbi:MAG: hydroxyethylthiazole kinase, partial [Pseudomonadota bacterium]